MFVDQGQGLGLACALFGHLLGDLPAHCDIHRGFANPVYRCPEYPLALLAKQRNGIKERLLQRLGLLLICLDQQRGFQLAKIACEMIFKEEFECLVGAPGQRLPELGAELRLIGEYFARQRRSVTPVGFGSLLQRAVVFRAGDCQSQPCTLVGKTHHLHIHGNAAVWQLQANTRRSRLITRCTTLEAGQYQIVQADKHAGLAEITNDAAKVVVQAEAQDGIEFRGPSWPSSLFHDYTIWRTATRICSLEVNRKNVPR